LLQQAPPQTQGMTGQLLSLIQTNPQGIYSMLLNPEALHQFPVTMLQVVVPILKSALVTSLHEVFLYGLIFVLLGALLAPLLGAVKLSDNKQTVHSK
jgi:hypothetical protein